MSTVPMVDWVLLQSGMSNKRRILAAFTCSLSADAPRLFWQEQRGLIKFTRHNIQRMPITVCPVEWVPSKMADVQALVSEMSAWQC